MKHKSPRVRAAYHLLIVGVLIGLILIGVIGILTMTSQDANAEKAPETQHWQLLTGDDAWLITPPECNLQITEFGGSYYFVCVGEKGE